MKKKSKNSEVKKKYYMFFTMIMVIILVIGIILLTKYNGNNKNNNSSNSNNNSNSTGYIDYRIDDTQSYSDVVENDDEELMQFDKNQNYSLEYFRLEKDSLTNKNKNLNIAAQEVPTKIVKDNLYFNDKKVNDIKIDKNIYLTDYYLITLTKTTDGEKYTFIDYQGHVIKTKSNRSLKDYSFTNLHLDNDKLYAKACLNGACIDQVEIAYVSDVIYIIFD